MAVFKKCKKCGKKFELGKDGTIEGCDPCNGVVRDSDGMAWFPADKVVTLEDIATGKQSTVKREDAFKK